MPHEYERRQALKKMAATVAARLMGELKAGRITKIDITIIRDAIWKEANIDPRNYDIGLMEDLEEMTTRRVVELVG